MSFDCNILPKRENQLFFKLARFCNAFFKFSNRYLTPKAPHVSFEARREIADKVLTMTQNSSAKR
jgi:hypothetical protein